MKQIYTLLTATLMLAGTALWSGCSNNELLENEKPGTEKPDNQQAASFKFSLKGMTKANTRAEEELTKPGETDINTLYVAFFIKDGNGKEADYELHRIFAYDGKATGEAWTDADKITLSEDGNNDYIIAEPGTVGDYVAYFIANPDEDMKTKFTKFQLSAGVGAELTTRTKLSDFEALTVKAGTADGTVEEGDESSKAARGFIMLAKQGTTLNTDAVTLQNINMTRLAARFDFINSAATSSDNKVEITEIKITNAAQTSRLMEIADPNNNETFQEQSVTLDSWKSDQTTPISAYTYENLNLKDANASKRLHIMIAYTLKQGSGESVTETKMTKDITLTVGESDLAVQRNHIYRIYMNGITGDFSVEVKDWNEGAIVTVPDKNLDIIYTKDSLGKIGDYVYLTDGKLEFSDGGLRKASLSGTLTWEKTMPNPEAGKNCIGIVFSNKMSNKDKAKGWTGYAVAPELIKTYNEQIRWAKEGYTGDNQGIPNCPIIKDLVNDRDGYTYCQLFEAAGRDNYPIYNKVVETMNAQAQLPTETSGWYVPSAGLICDMFYNLCSISALRSSYQDDNIASSENIPQVFRVFGGNYTTNKINAFTQRAVQKDMITNNINICSCSEIKDEHGAYLNISAYYTFKLCGYMDKAGYSYSSFAVFAFTYPPKTEP